jgi:hypothetical protein
MTEEAFYHPYDSGSPHIYLLAHVKPNYKPTATPPSFVRPSSSSPSPESEVSDIDQARTPRLRTKPDASGNAKSEEEEARAVPR